MVVRIRFGRGLVVSRRAGKNGRIANLAASFLTLIFIGCISLALWRVGHDLGWAGDFAFSAGILSHWQVWLGAAILAQYGAWTLSRYARTARAIEIASKAEEPAPTRAAANV